MKHTINKKSPFNDFILLRKTDKNTLLTKLFFTAFLFFCLNLFSNIQAMGLSETQRQTPIKKVNAKQPVKKLNTKAKTRKSTITRKDTVIEIDPANTSSPLFQKTNNQ